MNRLLLDALACENRARPPIWLMRQAGRYMPEYRALREKHSFSTMYKEPELAAKVTCLPIDTFGFDAAILFSDILVMAEAFGLGLHFEEKVGPIIDNPLSTEQDVDGLVIPKIDEKLHYVFKAIKMLKPQLKVPLIGFCGAPFTVASYMIEGKSSKDLKKTKRWMLSHPESFHRLLDKIAVSTIDYLKKQIEAGVDAIQIFDSWANTLAFPQFQEFSYAYLQKIRQELSQTNIPVILFCRGSSVFAEDLARMNPSCISLDWNCDIVKMRNRIPKHVALQGNLDPDVLYASKEILKKEIERILKGMKGDPAFIFNLGHGIMPDTPVDAVKMLVECVKNDER